jgi:anti-sigma factor RsiW
MPVTSEACRGRREDIGAHVLGTLDEARTTALIAHLDGCANCRAEVEELGAVARILPLADPVRTVRQPTPPRSLADSVFRAVRAEQRAARRKRLRQIAWGAIGVAAAVTALFVYLAVTSPQTAEVDFAEAPTGVRSHAMLEYAPGGTRIELDVDGLPEEVYNVWLEAEDGRRVPAGSFWASKDRPLEVTLTAALRLKDCSGIGISNADGKTLLYSEVNWDE